MSSVSVLSKSYLFRPRPNCTKQFFNFSLCKRYLTKFSAFTKTQDKVVEPQIEEDHLQDEKELQRIEKIRDKSRLKPHDRNELFGKIPYTEPITQAHLTVEYNRKMFGKYGTESGINPGIAWPTKADLQKRKEYEQVAYPLTIQEMVKVAKEEIERKERKIQENQERVIQNVAKLENWKKEIKLKIAKKEAEALAAQEKRDNLIEEVRRHFGYSVDMRDEKFKEMLALKQKEQRKKERLERSEEREKKAVAKLMAKHDITTPEV